ncbi:MAG: class I SAM-dependent methyltransferase [Fimbriiglobus sp.]
MMLAQMKKPWHFVKRRILAKKWSRNLYFDFVDTLRSRDSALPPSKLVYGIGDSLHVGETYLTYFRELAGLHPEEAVLDVGCGIGRMAMPLTKFLQAPGFYEGFDIMPENIAWCSKGITTRFPHFRFQHVDIFNTEYNPRGQIAAKDFRFPYPDQHFDFVFLTSIFTHLLAEDTKRYLAEIHRVLKPGGRCLATFFLLNGESESLVDSGRGTFPLLPAQGELRFRYAECPEACVAHQEKFVKSCLVEAGLMLTNTWYGGWCGRTSQMDDQDILLLSRPDQGPG